MNFVQPKNIFSVNRVIICVKIYSSGKFFMFCELHYFDVVHFDFISIFIAFSEGDSQ